jgi:hypothetical protein
MSVDTAWRLSTGRSDVVIAVHDSGIRWSDPGALADLRAKFHLNAGELPPPGGPCAPPPGGDPRDCNGDGVFNMPDYDGDPAVTDLNGNGVKDPEDLILAFSDGVDGDGNGYVDDIAGWDFFEFDNDPFDEVAFGHGTGEARDSTAEANNGGGVGTCPNCMVMPVRVGDSFVADVNSFAQGVVFSVDTGADVVQEALGTYNNSTFGRQAVEYAYRHGVPVVASAADEDSWHHNFPSAYAHTIVVNSIRDFGAPGGAPVVPNSWLFFNGCTNFGGNVAVSVPSTSCSSEATGRAAGLAGLLVSAGRDAVDASTLTTPLTANEVRQLLTQTADDIDFETPPGTRAVSFPDTVRYATQPGWDQFTGYGRVNVRSAVARVAAGDIPPEAELDAPDWFAPLYPARDGAFVVRGRAAAARASGYTWRVQIAYGIQPQEGDWVDVVPFGAPATAPVDGVLATVAPGQIPAPTPAQVARRIAQQPDVTSDYDRFTYTIRVQVRDQPANRLGEDRRTIFVVDDPDLKAGFPVRIGGDGASSPAIADLDGDGAGEIVYGTSDGLVHATRGDGSELPGWPVGGDPIPANPGSAAFVSGALALPVRGAILASVAVGDIDADGRLDVVAADMEGKVYAWNDAGARKPGFPVQVNLLYSSHAVKNPANTVDRAIIASPALADLDGDGGLDIVVAGNDRHVYVWNGFGVPRAGFPVLVVDATKMASIDPVNHAVTPLPGAFRGSKIVDSPALGDIDGDGAIDIVVGTNEAYAEDPNSSGTSTALNELLTLAGQTPGNTRVYAIHKDGTAHPGGPFLAGWPVPIAILVPEILPNVGEGVNASPALADVDGDGRLEVGVFAAGGPAYLLRADGTSFYGADPSGHYRVMATEGGTSSSPDTPSVPAVGEGAFGDLVGAGQLAFAAPAAGLARLLASSSPSSSRTRTTTWRPGSRRPGATSRPSRTTSRTSSSSPGRRSPTWAALRPRRSSPRPPATSCTPTTRRGRSRSAGRSSAAAGTSPTRRSATSTATAWTRSSRSRARGTCSCGTRPRRRARRSGRRSVTTCATPATTRSPRARPRTRHRLARRARAPAASSRHRGTGSSRSASGAGRGTGSRGSGSRARSRRRRTSGTRPRRAHTSSASTTRPASVSAPSRPLAARAPAARAGARPPRASSTRTAT